MSAPLRWFYRLLLMSLSVSRRAGALVRRLQAGLPRPADPLGDAPPIAVAVPGRSRWRAVRDRWHRVDRDMAFVGLLLVMGAVSGYVFTGALGGAAAESSPPIAGGPTATQTLDASTPSSLTPTPPVSGASASPTASPSVPVSHPPSPSAPLVPTPGAPSTRISTVLGRAGLPLLEVRWTAVDGAAYELAVAEVAGGDWLPVRLERPADPRALLAVGADRAYRVRVRAATDAGLSEWTVSEGFAMTVVDDVSRAVSYEGAWANAAHPLYQEGGARYARSSGATATLRFVGRSIGVRGPVGPRRGLATFFVDGQRVEAVDTDAGEFQARRVLFVRSWPAAAERRLDLVVAGTAGRPLVAVDAFYILETVAE